MRLFILLYVCFQVPGIAVSSKKLCTYQVKTRSVQTGGSVIIPCSYTNPKEVDEDEEIGIRWLEGGDPSCQQESKVISSPSETITENYYGRLSTGKDPNRNRTQNLEITKLQREDGPVLCCQIFNNKKPEKVWNKMLGTLLQFSDEESVTQLDELIAVSGEDIVIPCHYPKAMDSVQKVTWYQVQKNFKICDTEGTELYTWNKQLQHGRYSLVNFPEDISLCIQNISEQDEKRYCCSVTTTRDIMSKQVTALLVTDQESLSTKKPQDRTVQKGESIILTCSYNLPDQYRERDIVQTNVYWRVGSVPGPYAYHPYQEMVHSSYINRTHIIGTSLLIDNLQTEDNKTFHCFVVLKVCKGEGQYEDTIVYGGGTRLNFNGISSEERGLPTEGTYAIRGDTHTNGTSPTEVPQKVPPNYIIIIIISSSIILIILILILIVLKVKGVLCRRKINTSERQMNNIPAPGDGSNGKMQHSESTKKPDEVCVVSTDKGGREVMENGQMEDEDESLLYAKLDETKLNDKSRAKPPKHNEEILQNHLGCPI